MRENWLDSVCNDFRDEFIAEFAKCNWPKINESSRVGSFGNESKKSRIQGANHFPFEFRVLHKFQLAVSPDPPDQRSGGRILQSSHQGLDFCP